MPPDRDMTSTTPYADLTPELILSAAESLDLAPTGGFQALASYENRVYKIETEDVPWAVKFYRPNRWTDEAIAEEHSFLRELVDAEIPAVAPLARDGDTLFHAGSYRFAVFPWRPGRAGCVETISERQALGRHLGRLHLIGTGRFTARPTLDVASFMDPAVTTLADGPFLPIDLRSAFLATAARLRARVAEAFADVDAPILRLHGDCHAGNVLTNDLGLTLVDFDDCLNGPVIQDLWMLLPGDRDEQEEALAALLQGYELFRDFDTRELRLIEPLRTMRLLHYNAWLARRWEDPAFPRAFPWFAEDRHFRELMGLLATQEQRLDAPPICRRAP